MKDSTPLLARHTPPPHRWSRRCARVAAAGALLLGLWQAAGLERPRGAAPMEPPTPRLELARVLDAPGAQPSAPVCKGYRIVAPGSVLSRAQSLEFYSYWDSAGYTVSADISRIDGTAAEPLAGTYVGDAQVIEGDSVHVWPCYWFTHTLPETNPRPDGAGLPVPITAIRPAGPDTTTNLALTFCLSYHPPEHVRSRIIGDSRRYVERDGDTLFLVRNGDSLRIESEWRYTLGPFGIAADFSAVDEAFDPGDVRYGGTAQNGIARYWLYYELSAAAHTGSDYPLPLEIAGFDGGCGRDAIVLGLEMDNEGPTRAPVLDPLPEVSPSDTLEVSGTAYGDVHDVLLLLNGASARVASADSSYDTLRFTATLTLQAGTNQIVAYARDLVGNRSPASATATVELQDVPVFKGFVVASPESTTCLDRDYLRVDDDDLLLFHAYWDSRARYNVYADLRGLDSHGPAQLWATPAENRTVPVGDTLETWYGYRFEYSLSSDNQRADSAGIVVPVTAIDPTNGHQTTTESLRLCLCKHPPRHLRTRALGDPRRFVVREDATPDTLFVVRNGGSIEIQTSWRTPNRPLAVSADFTTADERFLPDWPHEWLVDSLSNDTTATYGIAYTFTTDACCGEGQASYPLPVPIRVKDAGCGCASTTLLLEMDNEGPGGGARFVPAPPGAVSRTPLRVAGIAPDSSAAARLEIEHLDADSTTIATLALDESWGFSADVALLAGANRLTAYGIDVVGNRSSPSAAHTVYLHAGAGIVIPRPFRPQDQFVFVDSQDWTELEVEIFNLEGDRIWSRVLSGDDCRRPVVWDGRNGRGENVHPGPFLLRARHKRAAGGGDEEVRAFVFQR